ncbi:hypothetical protein RFI_07058 [Reticulomyxa filosa]|uniref:DNA2/NAM7 helicase helicase domain-containing protein n=1 Tax=Reticulomyxa filosa TaxID=46433 RepID=X6NXR0_RETFI|nr:hypothetical protein RFI_07058 [Reticulomyxa filosa]|eukprot:ETO30062.1 hypothetical protein RFI_07058 [Reticulomyxa filosa]
MTNVDPSVLQHASKNDLALIIYEKDHRTYHTALQLPPNHVLAVVEKISLFKQNKKKKRGCLIRMNIRVLLSVGQSKLKELAKCFENTETDTSGGENKNMNVDKNSNNNNNSNGNNNNYSDNKNYNNSNNNNSNNNSNETLKGCNSAEMQANDDNEWLQHYLAKKRSRKNAIVGTREFVGIMFLENVQNRLREFRAVCNIHRMTLKNVILNCKEVMSQQLYCSQKPDVTVPLAANCTDTVGLKLSHSNKATMQSSWVWTMVPDSIKDRLGRYLNPSQCLAVEKTCQHKGITLLQGPPGTGKTRTVLHLMNAIHVSRTNAL